MLSQPQTETGQKNFVCWTSVIQSGCRNYYAEVWVRHADWKEAEFFDELPAHLRGEVAVYLMEEVFEQSDFFRYCSSLLLKFCQLPSTRGSGTYLIEGAR